LHKIAHLKKRAFLAAFAERGNVRLACQAAKVGRSSHYVWLKADADYAARFQEAQAEAVDVLEAEAHRRAVQGVKRPVYQGGKRVGYVQEYSDVLLIFLLKAARPETYRDNVHMTGQMQQEHTLVLDTIKRLRADDQARRALLAERIGGVPADGNGGNGSG
jgi:hypothetical protein